MTSIKRCEKNIEKLENKIEKEQLKIKQIQDKCEDKKITNAEFNIKKNHIEEKIHAMKSEISGLHGEVAKELRHLKEK